MSRVSAMLKDVRLVGGIVALAAAGAIAFGYVQVVQAAAPDHVGEVVQLGDFGTENHDPSLVLGAQAEKAERERVEAERIAAEEAARLAAEQAAAEEAARLAAAEEAADPEPVSDEPGWSWDDIEPEPSTPPYTGPDPGAQPHTICEVLADGTEVPCG
ncbi:hypothetical protein [Agromyces sp. ZXT2-6]|uniref:hypothetical protein n=1 Tax=Agromyces sp. ZXT2-6 TaxID=3461153 RepID=UPI0040550CF5